MPHRPDNPNRLVHELTDAVATNIRATIPKLLRDGNRAMASVIIGNTRATLHRARTLHDTHFRPDSPTRKVLAEYEDQLEALAARHTDTN